MPCATHLRAVASLSPPSPLQRVFAFQSKTAAPAFLSSICRGSSIASTKSTSPAPERHCHPAAVSASRSCGPSSAATAESSGRATAPRVARDSTSCSRKSTISRKLGGRSSDPAVQGATMPDLVQVVPRDGGALWQVTFGTGNGNILDRASMRELARVFVDAREASDLKAICLEGAGRDFSFGASVQEHERDSVQSMLETLRGLVLDLLDCHVVTL